VTSNPDEDRTMGVIPSRYSPVRTEADGKVRVELAGRTSDLGARGSPLAAARQP
jgi:hypothetical protein